MTGAPRLEALIAGVWEFPERKTARSALEIQAVSALAALKDAGLRPRDVDGYFTVAGSGGTGPLPILDYLNLLPRYVDGTSVGGASFVFHTIHAAAAIAQGRCRVALITYGSTARSSGIPVGTRERIAGDYLDQFEGIYGTSTVGLYAMVAQRHSHEYGTTEAQLAQIAVACRRHAGLNPSALYRDPITVEDVLRSPMISSPLHLLDCCVITDGGGAVVLVHPDIARDLPRPPIRILGAGEAVAHTAAGRRDYLVSAAAQTGPRALGEAGVSHADLDMAMIYDSFTITVLVTLEDLGFSNKGEGGAFVEGGRLELGGDLPINTDGGGLSSNHPGMRGIFLVIEAVRQLRGECGPRQVADCRLALVHGTGGALGSRHSGATLILARA
ncbi:MAG TPA: thiolase domain-containing protein [Methylomirabilota bacterium]|nr:thiolase domain-containing protein [Methylomirabilota bacterium]